jgi:hypothetical protein
MTRRDGMGGIMKKTTGIAVAAGLALLLASTANAAVITTNGLTFTSANDGPDPIDGAATPGAHLHSSNIAPFGLSGQAGKAEVGRKPVSGPDEEARGISEFSLSGLPVLSAGETATLLFNVSNVGGLFLGQNDTPFDGTITISAFQGNNLEDISDFEIAAYGQVGSFAATAAGLLLGATLTFDATALYNTAALGGFAAFGVRLAADPLPGSGGWAFDSFRLVTSTIDPLPPPPPGPVLVPEPFGIALFGTGLLGLLLARRRLATR